MRFVEAGEARLHVVDLGDPASGATPVVMLHGLLLGHVATWYFTAAPALASTRRVRLYDLRGHGRSSRPASGYDLATMSEDLEAVCAELDGPVDLVGHSYGALVALTFAIRRPERVRRLVLVEAPVPPGAPDEIRSFLSQDPEAMLHALPEGLRAAVAGGRRQARRLLEHLVGLATQTTLLADLGAMEAFPPQALHAVTVPVLGVYGTDSACREAGLTMVREMPKGLTRELPGGHYLHLDAAEALTAAIVEWLDG